jgi:hypothetical protein
MCGQIVGSSFTAFIKRLHSFWVLNGEREARMSPSLFRAL